MMNIKGMVCTAALALSVMAQPVLADKFAANCRYDYDYDEPAHQTGYGIFTQDVPGKHVHNHYRIRLDIDTDAGTVTSSSDTGGDTTTWHHGDMWRSSGKNVKVFVRTEGRFVLFGTNMLNDDGSVDQAKENRLDIESGLFNDSDGLRWECKKAEGNIFK